MSQHVDPSNHHPRKRKHLHVARPIYTEDAFQMGYTHIDEEITALDKLRNKVHKVNVTPKTVWHFLLRLIPILKWLPAYNLRRDIIGDTLSGLTTAVMRVPQGKKQAEALMLQYYIPEPDNQRHCKNSCNL